MAEPTDDDDEVRPADDDDVGAAADEEDVDGDCWADDDDDADGTAPADEADDGNAPAEEADEDDDEDSRRRPLDDVAEHLYTDRHTFIHGAHTRVHAHAGPYMCTYIYA